MNEYEATKAQIIEKLPPLAKLWDNPKISREERIAKLQELQGVLRQQQGGIVDTKSRIAALESAEKWLKLETQKLEKNDCSRLHKLHEAMIEGRILNTEKPDVAEPKLREEAGHLFNLRQPIVVAHNWAAAFQNAQDFDGGEIRMPFTSCAFELRVNGRTMILFVDSVESEEDVAQSIQQGVALHLGRFMCVLFFQEGPYWVCFKNAAKMMHDPLATFVWEQVRAISIALDAEVAQHDIMRAPSAVNEKRAKRGDIPMYDFHTVSLHGRITRQQMPSQHGTHRSPRLHFRRGHWRHYEMHKTWIRWTLVGNPELGFIDKSYRL